MGLQWESAGISGNQRLWPDPSYHTIRAGANRVPPGHRVGKPVLGYTFTFAIIPADINLVPAMARNTMGQGLPTMSSSTLKTMA